jgi:hypothetical protein
MNKSYFISAVCTPLTSTDALHEEGLAAHLASQWDNNGIDDANGGGKVDSLDFNIRAFHFGGPSKTIARADFNYDCCVDNQDFNLFIASYGTKQTTPALIASAPPLSSTAISGNSYADGELSSVADQDTFGKSTCALSGIGTKHVSKSVVNCAAPQPGGTDSGTLDPPRHYGVKI